MVGGRDQHSSPPLPLRSPTHKRCGCTVARYCRSTYPGQQQTPGGAVSGHCDESYVSDVPCGMMCSLEEGQTPGGKGADVRRGMVSENKD